MHVWSTDEHKQLAALRDVHRCFNVWSCPQTSSVHGLEPCLPLYQCSNAASIAIGLSRAAQKTSRVEVWAEQKQHRRVEVGRVGV